MKQSQIKSLRLSPDLEHRSSGPLTHEKKQALHDLVETGNFHPVNDDNNGPYDLYLKTEKSDLVMVVRDESGQDIEEVTLPVKPYKRLIKDYFLLIESHNRARQAHLPREKLEAIDMGRRGLHDEGAELLQNKLKNTIQIDFETARRFFTLMCALSIKNHSYMFQR